MGRLSQVFKRIGLNYDAHALQSINLDCKRVHSIVDLLGLLDSQYITWLHRMQGIGVFQIRVLGLGSSY